MQPFLSDLSGEDFWTLRQAGFRPVGIAVGNCTYYQVPTWNTQWATSGGFFSGSWNNQELPDYTQALYNARSLAMSRMEGEARQFGGVGIVGADIEVSVETREVDLGNDRHRTDMIYHYTSIGTAIAPYAGQHSTLNIPTVLDLK